MELDILAKVCVDRLEMENNVSAPTSGKPAAAATSTPSESRPSYPFLSHKPSVAPRDNSQKLQVLAGIAAQLRDSSPVNDPTKAKTKRNLDDLDEGQQHKKKRRPNNANYKKLSVATMMNHMELEDAAESRNSTAQGVSQRIFTPCSPPGPMPVHKLLEIVGSALLYGNQRYMTSSQIEQWIRDHIPSYRDSAWNWWAGIRRHMSKHGGFVSFDNPKGAGYVWMVKPGAEHLFGGGHTPRRIGSVETVSAAPASDGSLSMNRDGTNGYSGNETCQDDDTESELSSIDKELIGDTEAVASEASITTTRAEATITTARATTALEASLGVTSVRTYGGKPPYTTLILTGMALVSSPDHRATVSQIFEWVSSHFPFYSLETKQWKNYLRCELSSSRFFDQKHAMATKVDGDKGHMWTFEPAKKRQFLGFLKDSIRGSAANVFACSQCKEHVADKRMLKRHYGKHHFDV